MLNVPYHSIDNKPTFFTNHILSLGDRGFFGTENLIFIIRSLRLVCHIRCGQLLLQLTLLDNSVVIQSFWSEICLTCPLNQASKIHGLFPIAHSYPSLCQCYLMCTAFHTSQSIHSIPFIWRSLLHNFILLHHSPCFCIYVITIITFTVMIIIKQIKISVNISAKFHWPAQLRPLKWLYMYTIYKVFIQYKNVHVSCTEQIISFLDFRNPWKNEFFIRFLAVNV